jgi:hypothetical protein
VGNNEDGEKSKRNNHRNSQHRSIRSIDDRGGGHQTMKKLNRKQQITQMSCDSMCETDDETAEGGGDKENFAPSEG